MFIRRLEWERQRDELLEQRTRAAVLTEQTATHRTQTAFLIARINQLEKERAIYVRHITKLEIPVPELVTLSAPPIAPHDILAAMGSSLFDDMGDDEAKRQGLDWDTSGVVVPASRTNHKDPHA